MKLYLFLFALGTVVLAIVFGLAVGSRSLVESIWDIYLFEVPSGGYKAEQKSVIDAMPVMPDPADLPGMELRPGALILLYLGDMALDHLVPCALLGFAVLLLGAGVCVAKGLRAHQGTGEVGAAV